MNRVVGVICLFFLSFASVPAALAIEINESIFAEKLRAANNAGVLGQDTPEAKILETLNDVATGLSGNVTPEDVERSLALLDASDFFEELLPKETKITFPEDFLVGSNMTTADFANASYFLNSLSRKKLEKLERAKGFVDRRDGQFSHLEQELSKLSGSDISQMIGQLQNMPAIDLVGLSAQVTTLSGQIATGVKSAEQAIGSALENSNNELSGAASQIQSVTETLSYAAGAAMAGAAYSLQQAADAISNTIAAGVAVDLEALSQGMGFDSFAEAVSAYNAQYGTSYTVDQAREALGQ